MAPARGGTRARERARQHICRARARAARRARDARAVHTHRHRPHLGRRVRPREVRERRLVLERVRRQHDVPHVAAELGEQLLELAGRVHGRADPEPAVAQAHDVHSHGRGHVRKHEQLLERPQPVAELVAHGRAREERRQQRREVAAPRGRRGRLRARREQRRGARGRRGAEASAQARCARAEPRAPVGGRRRGERPQRLGPPRENQRQ